MDQSKNCNQKDFSRFDNLRTSELEAILRADSYLENDEESDLDAIIYITEVLAKREEESNAHHFTDNETAWKSFNENYRPYEGDGTSLFDFDEPEEASKVETPKRRSKSIKKVRRFVTIAAVIAIVFAASTVTAYAKGFDLFGFIAQWTKETFGFVDSNAGSNDFDQDAAFGDLKAKLREYDIPEDILPTWLPDGYVFNEVKVDETPLYVVMYATFASVDNELSIMIRSYSDIGICPTYEIHEDDARTYISNDITYYLSINFDSTRISWANNNYECSIMCSLDEKTVYQIIDSICER